MLWIVLFLITMGVRACYRMPWMRWTCIFYSLSLPCFSWKPFFFQLVLTFKLVYNFLTHQTRSHENKSSSKVTSNLELRYSSIPRFQKVVLGGGIHIMWEKIMGSTWYTLSRNVLMAFLYWISYTFYHVYNNILYTSILYRCCFNHSHDNHSL
jgi:hypothetical protein